MSSYEQWTDWSSAYALVRVLLIALESAFGATEREELIVDETRRKVLSLARCRLTSQVSDATVTTCPTTFFTHIHSLSLTTCLSSASLPPSSFLSLPSIPHHTIAFPLVRRGYTLSVCHSLPTGPPSSLPVLPPPARTTASARLPIPH